MLIRAAVTFSITFVLGPLRSYISTYFWKAGSAKVAQSRMPSTNVYSRQVQHSQGAAAGSLQPGKPGHVLSTTILLLCCHALHLFICCSRSALPSEWDKRQWGRHQTAQQYLKVDGCTVKYVGPGESDKQAASIYADHPVSCPAAPRIVVAAHH
jgi:hypothetical protein